MPLTHYTVMPHIPLISTDVDFSTNYYFFKSIEVVAKSNSPIICEIPVAVC